MIRELLPNLSRIAILVRETSQTSGPALGDRWISRQVARCAPELMGHMRPVGYLFLVADCALRSACSAHAIHAAAISIHIALSFSDARCAKRRHSAAYSRNRTASFSMQT